MATSDDFGSYDWGLRTAGRLSFREKVRFFLQAATAKVALSWPRKRNPVFLDVSEMTLPDSSVVWEALVYAKQVHELPLVQHGLRTYVLGVVFATQEKLQYDPELYAVAALLYNLGLEEAYCRPSSGLDCFAIEGAQMAGRWLEQQPLSASKIKVIQEAIAQHLNVSVAPTRPEAYLLNKASGTDAIGIYRHQIHDQTMQQLLGRYPLEDGHAALNQQLLKETEKRPDSRMALLYQLGFERLLLQKKT